MASASAVVNPEQTVVVPVMFAGVALIVTTTDLAQPVLNVYATVLVPGPTLETTPSVPTTATVLFELDHVPPDVAVASVVVFVIQVLAVPVIAAGRSLTVIVFVAKHPVAVILYVIMAVPAVIPVTTPVVEPTDALDGLLLCQVPPLSVLDSEMVPLTHTAEEPAIVAGTGFTVTARVPVTNGDAHVPGSVQVTTAK